ncbi:MAG: aminotransferase class I/II-fold pyridoxal phosphate-dependent enzyme [Actinomycetaceae bacterium]|nr:aminotransferase class I/II-fold pyridoxal phosphate-dependent enzyme [Actinomycetaceae bacterium]
MRSPLPRSLNLPVFPWDTLLKAKNVANQHPDGIVDLSIGTPVDATPEVVQEALKEASDAPGYPTALGSEEFQIAVEAWCQARGMGYFDPDRVRVMPTVGSKEMVAWLPFMLGMGAEDRILIPRCAYPTYEIGARLIGAEVIPVDHDPSSWPDASLVWLNSPANPDGSVLSMSQLRAVVEWAREHNAVVASDECYAALVWDRDLIDAGGCPSLLSYDVCDGDYRNLLVLYSVSKQSNMAGYRAGLMLGDRHLIDAVLEVRKHTGMIQCTPTLAAMSAALRNSVGAFEWPGEGVTTPIPQFECDRGHSNRIHGVSHVVEQRALYAARREKLLQAFEAIGLVNHPESRAGLYLWLSDTDSKASDWELVDALSKLGILVAPGSFYGPDHNRFIRVSLSATDERVNSACERMYEVDSSFLKQLSR